MRVCMGTRGTKANVRLRATTLWRGRKTWQEEGDREKGQVRGRKEKRKGGGGEGKESRTQVGVGSVCKPRTAKATCLLAFSPPLSSPLLLSTPATKGDSKRPL